MFVDIRRDFSHYYFFGSFILVLVIWMYATSTGMIDPIFLPSPYKIYDEIVRLFVHQEYTLDIVMTLLRVVIAFVLSVGIALPVAFLLALSPIYRAIFLPYTDFLRYVPVPALIPLVVLFLGVDESAKVALLFLGTVFQLIVLFMTDVLRVPEEYRELGYSLHFKAGEYWYMLLRSALPDLYTNTRITLGICWSYVLIAELLGAQVGIGHMMKEAQRFSHTGAVFVGIFTIALIGYVGDRLLQRGYKYFFPYKL